MTVGALIANFAKHHDSAFHEIEHVQWPFMILFFLLAGASLEVGQAFEFGWLTAVYAILRILARFLGGWIGARVAGVADHEQPWYGSALLPQAGVAVGLALVAGEAQPDWAPAIMTLTLAATVVFKLIGPPVTYLAVKAASRD